MFLFAIKIISYSVYSYKNISHNRKVVFRSKTNVAIAAVKYITLAVFILICNTLVLKGLTGFGIAPYAAKIITELIMFVFNYLIQHSFIFKKEVKAT